MAAVVGVNIFDDAVRGRCSGALIQLDYDRLAVLTAGHCAAFWFAVGNDAVGVSFDPVIGGDPDTAMGNSLDPGNYFVGGTVVLHPEYGPPNAMNPKNDLAIVVFDQEPHTGSGLCRHRRARFSRRPEKERVENAGSQKCGLWHHRDAGLAGQQCRRR